MDMLQVAKDNHAFYFLAVGMAMCEDAFSKAVLESVFSEHKGLYAVEYATYSGYISIDTADIKKQYSQSALADAVRKGVFGDISMKIPYSVKGELNTDVEVTAGIFNFGFNISKYERDSEHNFEMVDDLSLLPEEERLGRFVSLKITINPIRRDELIS